MDLPVEPLKPEDLEPIVERACQVLADRGLLERSVNTGWRWQLRRRISATERRQLIRQVVEDLQAEED